MDLRLRRGAASVEDRALDSPWKRLTSPAVLAGVAGLALLAGKAVVDEQLQLGLLMAAGLLGVAVFRFIGLPGWCSLLLVTAIAARGMRTAVGLPQIADFLHYPVALGFVAAAIQRQSRFSSRRPRRWLAGFLVVVAVSAIAHPNNPLRMVLFVLIAGEPLLLIWAVSRWGVDRTSLESIGRVALVLAAIQVPIGVYQGLTYGWTDPVQGTLSGHGAGHHVLGGLFALALFVVVAAVLSRRVSVLSGAVAGAACVGMIIATGSMAVLVIGVLAALAAPLLGFRSLARTGGRRFGVVLIVAVLGAAALAFAAVWVPGIYERAADLATSREQYPEVEIITERANSDPLALLLGSGPGTSGSRASLLLIGPKEGSPLEFLGLEPTELGIEFFAASSNPAYGGSVESAASSTVGVVGDLGLVGLVALGALFVAMWREVGMSRNWLAPAARSAIVMVSGLSLVDNWLEYPEFAIPFALLVGIVLGDVPDNKVTSRERQSDSASPATRTQRGPLGVGTPAESSRAPRD